MDPATRVKELTKELNEHSHRYYVLDDPIISDAQFDHMFRELQALEEAHPELKTHFSPTQRVGGEIASGFEKVVHEVPMLSLHSVFSFAEVLAWDLRNQKELKQGELF